MAKGKYISIGTFVPDEILPYIVSGDQTKSLREKGFKPGDEEWAAVCEKEFGGYMIKMASLRYRVFATKGLICTKCGIKGTFFSLEKHSNDKSNNRFHFNLYAADGAGESILMTKDHVVPKAKGGSNTLDNLQTMCARCNSEKADNI